MADLLPTTVKLTPSNVINTVTAGEGLSVGSFYYLSSSDNKAYLCNNTTESDAYVSGVVVTAALPDEIAVVTTGGDEIDLGVTVTAGELYVVAGNNGRVMQYADLTATDWITWACYGSANGKAVLFHKPMGQQKA